MKILLLGSDGQLGRELLRAERPAGWHVHAPARDEFDLSEADTLHRLLDRYPADVLINAAAYTAVDQAEEQPEMAHAVNRDGPAMLAELCAADGRPMIHVSTDYVFDGTSTEPYSEDDPVRPINVYGASKAAGDHAVRETLERHLILRTSWLYSPFCSNFVKTMLRLADDRDEVRVVNDQRGSPTAAGDLAAAINQLTRLIASGEDVSWGTYHYAGDGETTWHGFADCIFKTLDACGQRRPHLKPVASSEFPTRAARPANSVLNCTRITRTFGIEPRPWRESCARVVQECLAARQEVSR